MYLAPILEAWEGKDRGGMQVPLANHRWERQLLRFLKLSGVGKVVEDGTDEEQARDARLDGWIAWKVKERVAQEVQN